MITGNGWKWPAGKFSEGEYRLEAVSGVSSKSDSALWAYLRNTLLQPPFSAFFALHCSKRPSELFFESVVSVIAVHRILSLTEGRSFAPSTSCFMGILPFPPEAFPKLGAPGNPPGQRSNQVIGFVAGALRTTKESGGLSQGLQLPSAMSAMAASVFLSISRQFCPRVGALGL